MTIKRGKIELESSRTCSGNSTGPIATTISIAPTKTKAGISLSSRGGFESLTSDIKAKLLWLSIFREMKVGPASSRSTSPACLLVEDEGE